MNFENKFLEKKSHQRYQFTVLYSSNIINCRYDQTLLLILQKVLALFVRCLWEPDYYVWLVLLTSKSLKPYCIRCKQQEEENLPERIPSITLNVNSLLTSSGSWHSAEGHKSGQPTPLQKIIYRVLSGLCNHSQPNSQRKIK